MLYVITNTQNSIAGFILNPLQNNPNIRLIDFPKNKKTFLQKILCFLGSKFVFFSGKNYLPLDFLAATASIGPEDQVLFFDIDYHRDLAVIKKNIPPHAKTHLFLWNSIRQHNTPEKNVRKKINFLRSIFNAICTFDPVDAATYQFKLIPQPYRTITQPHTSTDKEIDLYFIGSDKGRLSQLSAIKKQAEDAGLNCFFHITPDKKIKYSAADNEQLSTRHISYQENIDLAQRSKCLVEIVQKNQTGPTLRALEALFFNRKLITNNQYAHRMPGYAPDRVLILEPTRSSHFFDFINQPHQAVPPDALKAHQIENWIKEFMR